MNRIDGRIIKDARGLYFVDTEKGIYKCSARGIFRKDNQTPVIGDFVTIEILSSEKGQKGLIREILVRKNELIRPRVSNVDLNVIVFSPVSPGINEDLLDRIIILSEEKNVGIAICINKTDLVDAEHLEHISSLYDGFYDVFCVSAKYGEGFDRLKTIMDKKVTVFSGPSGVGKSSIINHLIPGALLKTGNISQKIERGKHTTRHVELIRAWKDTFIIDTPGFTSLSLEHIPETELQNYFKEFLPFAGECKFADCVHMREPDCAVKRNVGKTITEQRYKKYCDLMTYIIQRR